MLWKPNVHYHSVIEVDLHIVQVIVPCRALLCGYSNEMEPGSKLFCKWDA